MRSPRRTQARLPKVKLQWLALEMQERRRKRASRSSSLLMVDLVQFYKPVGGTFVRSWNETESVPANPFAGITSLVLEAGSSTYQQTDVVRYTLFPYRTAGQRIYSGAALVVDVDVEATGMQVRWPAWTGSPTWVTGFSVTREVNGSYSGFRDISLVVMVAGWVDAGGGWSPSSALPCTFAAPPITAKVLWNTQSRFYAPSAMQTVSSPLGGLAYDSAGQKFLSRLMSQDLRRDMEGTLAFWMCPAPGGAGGPAGLRGKNKVGHVSFYESAGTELYFGFNYEITITPAEPDDWYLVVLRNDKINARYRMDLIRLRDGAHFGANAFEMFGFGDLTESLDFLEEGIWAALWCAGVDDPSADVALDRIGVWTRSITDDEVESLFNCGLGWQPA